MINEALILKGIIEKHEAFVPFGKFIQNEVLNFSCGKKAQSEPGFLVKIVEFGAWRSPPISNEKGWVTAWKTIGASEASEQ